MLPTDGPLNTATWGIVVVKPGGSEELSWESLRNVDVVAFRHPKDPLRIPDRIDGCKYARDVEH